MTEVLTSDTAVVAPHLNLMVETLPGFQGHRMNS